MAASANVLFYIIFSKKRCWIYCSFALHSCFILKPKITLICFHSLYHSLPFAVTRCHSLSLVVICCHSLSLVVPLVTRCTTRCRSLSFVVPLAVIRCHSLYHSLSLVVTQCTIRCHSLSLVVLFLISQTQLLSEKIFKTPFSFEHFLFIKKYCTLSCHWLHILSSFNWKVWNFDKKYKKWFLQTGSWNSNFDNSRPWKSILIHGDREKVIWAGGHRKVNGIGAEGWDRGLWVKEK